MLVNFVKNRILKEAYWKRKPQNTSPSNKTPKQQAEKIVTKSGNPGFANTTNVTKERSDKEKERYRD